MAAVEHVLGDREPEIDEAQGVAAGEATRLLADAPQPLETHDARRARGAPHQAQLHLQRLADAGDPARRQLCAGAVGEDLALRRADAQKQQRRAVRRDLFREFAALGGVRREAVFGDRPGDAVGEAAPAGPEIEGGGGFVGVDREEQALAGVFGRPLHQRPEQVAAGDVARAASHQLGVGVHRKAVA